MPYQDTEKNSMLSGFSGRATHAAAFDGDPSGAGTELDRQLVSWDAPAGGVVDISASVDFTIPGGSGVDHIAFFDDPSAGTLRSFGTVTREDYAEQGTYTLNSAAHDLNA